MKHNKLAEGTLNTQDYQIIIDFLKKKKNIIQ